MFCKGKYGQVSRSNFHDCTIYHNWKSRICFHHCYLDRAANSYNIAKGASIYSRSINRSPHAYFPRPMSNIAGKCSCFISPRQHKHSTNVLDWIFRAQLFHGDITPLYWAGCVWQSANNLLICYYESKESDLSKGFLPFRSHVIVTRTHEYSPFVTVKNWRKNSSDVLRRINTTHNLCTPRCDVFSTIMKESRCELINSTKPEKGTPESIRVESTLSARAFLLLIYFFFFFHKWNAWKLFDLYRAAFVRISSKVFLS